MRQIVLTCDECSDDDSSTLACVIDHGRNVFERLDLCSFCRGEIDGVSVVSAEDAEPAVLDLLIAA